MEWSPRRAPARHTGLPRIMRRRRITCTTPKTMGDRKRQAAGRLRRGTTCHDRPVPPTATARPGPKPHRPPKEHLANQALRRAFLDRRVHIGPARHHREAPCQAHSRPTRKIRLRQEMSLGRRVLLGRNPPGRAQLVRVRKMLRGQPRALGRRTRHLSMKLRLARKRRGRNQLRPRRDPRKADTRIRPSARRSLTGGLRKSAVLVPIRAHCALAASCARPFHQPPRPDQYSTAELTVAAT
jgi:hypothetical protein